MPLFEGAAIDILVEALKVFKAFGIGAVYCF